MRYKYELEIDRVYFEKNFKNTGTRGAYSEFVTRQSILTKFFRRVLELTPASTTPATSATGEITPPTIRPTVGGRIVGGASTAITVLGSLHLLNQLRDAFAGRVQIELKDLDPGDFEVGHEFRGVLLAKEDNGTPWYIDVRVERNIFFVKQFYAFRIYTIA